MRIRDLVFGEMTELIPAQKQCLILVKPLYGLLYRVWVLPDMESEERQTELRQVLNTTCKFVKDDIWYFRIPDEETMVEFGTIFMEMGIEHYFALIGGEPTINN